MNFFKKPKNVFTVFFLIFASISLIKCGYEAKHLNFEAGVDLDQMIHNVDNTAPQITSLADALDSLPPEDRDLVINKTFDITFKQITSEGVALLDKEYDEKPWDQIYNFFVSLGTIIEDPNDPEKFKPFTNDIGSIIHVYSNNPKNKIRYLNAGFKPSTDENGDHIIGEKHLSFEVEKSLENMQETLRMLESSFIDDFEEPCHTAGKDWYFYKKDEWIVEVKKETTESIEDKINNSYYPVRTLDDVGVILVSISQGGHNHIIEGTGCVSDHAH